MLRQRGRQRLRQGPGIVGRPRILGVDGQRGMGRGPELLESVLLVQHSEARRVQLGVLTQVQELLKPLTVRAIALLGRRARAERSSSWSPTHFCFASMLQ